MTVRVLFFAVARDLAGVAERAYTLGAGATAADVVNAVVADVPGLAAHAAKLATAVNLEYVGRDHVLSDGDELAIIPPVSGGAV